MPTRDARLDLVGPEAERATASVDRLNRIDTAIRDMAASCPVPGALRMLVERLGEPNLRAKHRIQASKPGQNAIARKRG